MDWTPRERCAVLAAAAVVAAALPRAARAAADRVDRFHGTARDASGAVLYLETHDVESRAGRPLSATTTYRDPGGAPIAVLSTDFSRDPFAPTYRFEDLRTRAVEEVVVSERELTLVAAGRRRTVARPEDPARRLVAGQGLDRYVRERLEALEAGEELHVAFAIPSRHETYGFRVRRSSARGDRVRVRVEIDSWVLRLFASALDVEYDRATRRLVRYRGPSNLVDERGENPLVEITYAYPAPAHRAEEAGRAAP